MTRPDRKETRRARALETMKNSRERTKAQIERLEEDMRLFERNERSLRQPTAAVQRQLQDLKRELDRQNMEISALENTRRTLVSAARFIDQNPKDW